MASGEQSDESLTQHVDTAFGAVEITSAMNRRNGWIFLTSNLLIYLAIPFFSVDVVQAALCDKLGASATVANLPASAYLFGSFAPILLTWVIPYRLERAALVWSYLVTAILLGVVFATLCFPVSNTLRISAVILQGLLQGISESVTTVYIFQCLGRGTTSEGRARTLKLTYTFAPIAAVIGSLATQFVMNRGIRVLHYPYDFASLYFVGTVFTIGNALISTQYKLTHVEETERPPFFRYMVDCLKSYSRVRALGLLWLAYVLCDATISITPNLALYTRQALGREPKELIGVITALRHGFKALSGYILGATAIRWGARGPLIGAVLMMGGAILYAWVVPGYWFLLAFGLMGAGELGRNYFVNYVLGVSPPGEGARNVSVLILAAPAASAAPALHGALTDKFGFRGSFVFGSVTALLALWLVLKIPPRPSVPREVPVEI